MAEVLHVQKVQLRTRFIHSCIVTHKQATCNTNLPREGVPSARHRCDNNPRATSISKEQLLTDAALPSWAAAAWLDAAEGLTDPDRCRRTSCFFSVCLVQLQPFSQQGEAVSLPLGLEVDSFSGDIMF